MRKGLIIGGSVLLVILIFIAYQLIKTPSIQTGVSVIKDVNEDVEQLLIDFKNDGVSLENVEKYHSPEGTLQYFFAVAMLGEIDLVPEVFTLEQFNKDFMELNLDERFDEMEATLNEVTRNQTLEKIDVLRSMWTFSKDTTRTVIDVYYSDLDEPIRLNILLRKEYHEHIAHGDYLEDSETEMYHIDMSIHEIKRKIKEGART